jgi:hypothetical protein
MVCCDSRLRCALYRYLEERFSQSSAVTQMRALRTVTNVISPLLAKGDKSFFWNGPFRAVKCATVHVFSNSTVTQEETDISRMKHAMAALERALLIVSRAPLESWMRLNVGKYRLSRKDMRCINVMAYNLLSSFWAEHLLGKLSAFLIAYADYLSEICDTDALRSFLLYKPPGDSEAKPIALRMAGCAIHCGEARKEDEIMYVLREYGGAVPEVEDILLWLPAPPIRVEKDRRCAKPNCYVVGDGLYNNHKKCARCMAVYYCCKKHQVEHWPEHRLTCVKAVAVST